MEFSLQAGCPESEDYRLKPELHAFLPTLSHYLPRPRHDPEKNSR